jgi:hypothetical protein
VRAHGAHTGPVVAQTARELGQQGVFLDRLVNAIQIVGHGGQVAARQLGAQGAAVEQGGRGRHEVERRQNFVELDGTRFAVDFVDRQAHGHAHEESLGHFDALLAHVQEIAVVKGLQAQVIELQITLGLEGLGQFFQVKLHQLVIEQVVIDAFLDELGEIVDVFLGHLVLGHFLAQDFLGDGVHQQAGRDIGVVRVFLDQCAGSQDGGLVHLFHGHTVVQVAHGLGHDGLWTHIFAQASAGVDHQRLQVIQVQCDTLATVQHMQCRFLHDRCGLLALLCTFLGTTLAVQHIGAGHFVVRAAHQTQFNLVLHVFDVEGAATGA